MENLIFKSREGWFVTDPIDGGDNGVVAFQLSYPEKGAHVFVETCIDKALGWNAVCAKEVNDTYCDVINGVIDGLNVRIRTNYMPAMAKKINL